MTTPYHVQFTTIIGRCKDCPFNCELYESGWNIPEDCPLQPANRDDVEMTYRNGDCDYIWRR